MSQAIDPEPEASASPASPRLGRAARREQIVIAATRRVRRVPGSRRPASATSQARLV